jgi:hypothetical protein
MNSVEAIKTEMNEDELIAEKAAAFFKLIEEKIALKSFQGARDVLLSTYAKTLLGEDTVEFLKSKINEAEGNYKKDGNRLHWEWHVIFVFSTLSAGYIVWKFGMV